MDGDGDLRSETPTDPMSDFNSRIHVNWRAELRTIFRRFPDGGETLISEGQMRDRLRAVADLCATNCPGDIVEIGAHLGLTTILFCEVARKHGRRVIAIDPWQWGTQDCHGNEYGVFMENVAPWMDVLDIIRLPSQSRGAVEALSGRQLCFAFVDGLHTYQGCLSDLRAVGHTQGLIATDDIRCFKQVWNAFNEGAAAMRRRPVRQPNLREGYLLPFLSVQDVAELVADRLRQGRPCSVIRLGDGEGRLLGWPSQTSECEIRQRLTYWFGRDDFTLGQVGDMGRNLYRAIQAADVVGLPDETKRGKHWLTAARQVVQMDGLRDDMLYCCQDAHISLWAEGLLKAMMAEARHVSLVTCRDMVAGGEEAYGLEDVTWHPVPEEGFTGGKATNHYPIVFEEMREKLSGRDRAGELALVGAGPLGKSYCQWFREAGGVAVDIGSVFDAMAGVASRGWIRDFLTDTDNN